MAKIKQCPTCSGEMASNAKCCPNCGAKNKKPFYTRWWFWGVLIVIFAIVAGSGGEKASQTTPAVSGETAQQTSAPEAPTSQPPQNEPTLAEKPVPEYSAVSIQELNGELKSNALRAEKQYQNAYVTFTGKLDTIDSDGSYITVCADDDEWGFESIQCFVQDDSQLDVILEKSTGDLVTVSGQITSIGELLGYHLDIHTIE